jgi:hypothetical protein
MAGIGGDDDDLGSGADRERLSGEDDINVEVGLRG